MTFAPALAAVTAAFRARADLPTPDWAAITMTLPRRMPEVTVSGSDRPWGSPVCRPFWISSSSAT